MAALAALDVDLTHYTETQFLSKSKILKDILGPLIRQEVELNSEMYDCLIKNDYRAFDQYVDAHPGIDNFYKILQQIFMFRYFLPEGKPTHKQIQNALGIQQARWSTDDENKDTYPVGKLTFHYYQERVPSYDSPFNEALMKPSHGGILQEAKLYPEFKQKSQPEQLQIVHELLRDTIWYSYEEEAFLNMYHRNTPCRLFWIREPLSLGKRKADADDVLYCNCFPLPESISNLCEIACLHNAELVFGSLSTPTIIKYYIMHGKRPHHCHLAKPTRSDMNLKNADGINVHLLNFWTHDIQHEALGECSPDTMLVRMNRKVGRFARSKGVTNYVLTAENIKTQFEDEKSMLNQFIQDEKDSGTPVSELLSITDEPGVWENGRTPCFKGGKRTRRTKRSRSARYTRLVRRLRQ